MAYVFNNTILGYRLLDISYDRFVELIMFVLLFPILIKDIQLGNKYKDIYEARDPNIPYDIQILIRKKETGLALLRLVEIIGEDKITDIGSETLYFIISVLNQLDLDNIRNKLILKVLPLKV